MKKEETSFEMFGSYLLLDRIACGGMAAIFLARPAASSANGRILIIKRILPQVANDPEFVKMFRSEIQVCMGLNHPNIVQLYDFGHIERQPYIAMEYIEGKSIRQLISQFTKRNQAVPIGVAASVAAQAAAGLHYAHTFKNRVTGEALNVIHRDVSPQNILLSYEGNVKLIDFGIAKAEINDIDQTRTGSIKGKVCYLSPEQARRETLDGRSDVFSLGAVLWEMLTGQKLFTLLGRDDLEVMEMIKNSEKFVRPPSVVNPKVPKELDDIVLKSLAKNRAERYENAEEFQKALRKFILRYFPGFGYSDVSKVAKAAFSEELVEERTRIRNLNAQAQELLSADQATRASMSVEPAPFVPKFISSGNTNPNIAVAPTALQPPTYPGQGMYVQGTPSYIPMPAYAPQGQQQVPTGPAPRFPFITRTRMLFTLLYVCTIWFLQVDREYFLLERFFIPTEVVRMASTQPPARHSAVAQAGEEEEMEPTTIYPGNRPMRPANRAPASARSVRPTQHQAPTPVETLARQVLLKINVSPATSLLPTRITVNGMPVSAKTGLVKIPMDRKVIVTVERESFGTYRNEFTLNSDDTTDPSKVFTLPVKLEPRGRR